MKQNTLKTLAFTIAMVCVGSLYGQTKTFQKITSMDDLTDGNYLIVRLYKYNGNYYALGAQKGTNKETQNRIAAPVTVENGIIKTNVATTNTETTLPYVIELTKTTVKINKINTEVYTLYDSVNDGYLASKSSNSNEMKVIKPIDETAAASITIAADGHFSIVFYGDNSRREIRGYQSTTFSCYSEGGFSNTDLPYLFKEVTYAYSRDISSTNIGTICLPYSFDVSENTDAKFYEIAGKTTENDNTVLVFNQVDELEAGIPYIFKPESGTTSLSFDYTGIANPETTAGNKNGLYGTFADISDIKTTIENTIEKEVYLVKNNIIQRCGIKNILYANRAYIVMSEVPIYDTSKSQAKAILRVPIDDSSTGIEEVAGSEAQPMEYHSVNGTKLSAPQKGLNIIKMNDGSTQKVFVP